MTQPFCQVITVEVIIEGINLLEKVKQSKVKDDKIIKAVEEMK